MSEPTPMPTYWALAEEVTHLHGRLDQLKAENDKLRELVRDMAECLEHSKPFCKKCKFQELGSCLWFKVFVRMDELGIEVD